MDMNDLVKHARELQEQMKKAQEEALNRVVEGESGAGMVKVTMNGRHDVKKVAFGDGLLAEDKAVVEDLIAAAINDAVRKIEDSNKDSLSGMASGIKFPKGFEFPN